MTANHNIYQYCEPKTKKKKTEGTSWCIQMANYENEKWVHCASDWNKHAWHGICIFIFICGTIENEWLGKLKLKLLFLIPCLQSNSMVMNVVTNYYEIPYDTAWKREKKLIFKCYFRNHFQFVWKYVKHEFRWRVRMRRGCVSIKSTTL